MRRHRTPTPTKRSGPGGGPMTPLESSGDALEEAALFARSSYSPLDADAPTRPSCRASSRLARCRAIVRPPAAPRPVAPLAAGEPGTTVRPSAHAAGRACRPAARRCRRVGCAALGGRREFVLLVDGSRSMSAYARTALQIAVALASATMRVEVFTFSTALQRVTGDVRRAAAGEARRLDRLHHAWAGGTTIGACLREFLRRFGERMVGRDTVVIIASDGLDVGVPDMLRDAMRELHRRSAGVVWLNPLLETEGYEPTARRDAARPVPMSPRLPASPTRRPRAAVAPGARAGVNEGMVAGLNERRRRTLLKALKMWKLLREMFVVAGARNQLYLEFCWAAA